MDVAIGYHRSERAARATVAALEASGAQAAALRADLGDARAARRLVERAARALGGLDVLVNSAAVFMRTPLATTTLVQYDALLDLNARSAFLCAQAAAEMLGEGGHIVNIGDAGAGRGWPNYIPYTMSKAAMVALTRGLAVALRPRGIAVNCVAPGAVLRPLHFSRTRWARLTGGDVDHVEEVARAVVFFATCPAHITGQVLAVDGGEHP